MVHVAVAVEQVALQQGSRDLQRTRKSYHAKLMFSMRRKWLRVSLISLSQTDYVYLNSYILRAKHACIIILHTRAGGDLLIRTKIFLSKLNYIEVEADVQGVPRDFRQHS